MTNKDKIIALHREHPTWNTSRIAREVKCTTARVRNVRLSEKLRIPWISTGRPRTKMPASQHWNIASGFLSAGA